MHILNKQTRLVYYVCDYANNISFLVPIWFSKYLLYRIVYTSQSINNIYHNKDSLYSYFIIHCLL